MPDFLIIGAQKCGTTSLYHYLVQHPQIVPALQKEVHFFDLNFDKGLEWYQAQFQPLNSQNNLITGEASPYYIFHPLVPERVYQLFPKVKLIALLRNPVDRAISHYYHEVRLGYETMGLEDAIASEPIRLKGEIEKIIADGNYYSFNHRHFTYLSRGIYIDQLQTWMKYFPKEQFLIIPSDDLFINPDRTLTKVFEFLGLPAYQLTHYTKYNSGEYPPISQEIYQQLQAYFKPHNQKLETLLAQKFYA